MSGTKVFGSILNGLIKHGPKIAACVGGMLLVGGGYLLGREVPKYQAELEKRKEEAEGELPKKEKVKIFAKHFAAPFGTILAGVCGLGAAVFESERRIRICQETGIAATAVSEAATRGLQDYKQAAAEVVGEEKVGEIEKKVNDIQSDRFVTKTPIPIAPPQPGKYWCKNIKFGGEWFQTDVGTLEAAENELTRRLIIECDERATATLNDANELIGCEFIEAGDRLVFRYNEGKRGYKMVDLGISSTILNGMPIITISPKVEVVFEDSNGNTHYCEL